MRDSLNVANATIAKLEEDKNALVKNQKPLSAGAIENKLRQELKKEYSKKLVELRQKTKNYKNSSRAFLCELMNPCSRFFESFDFTKDKDVDEYIEHFKIAGRKINA